MLLEVVKSFHTLCEGSENQYTILVWSLLSDSLNGNQLLVINKHCPLKVSDLSVVICRRRVAQMTKGSMEALRSHLEGNFCVQLGISGVTFTADAAC